MFKLFRVWIRCPFGSRVFRFGLWRPSTVSFWGPMANRARSGPDRWAWIERPGPPVARRICSRTRRRPQTPKTYAPPTIWRNVRSTLCFPLKRKILFLMRLRRIYVVDKKNKNNVSIFWNIFVFIFKRFSFTTQNRLCFTGQYQLQ